MTTIHFDQMSLKSSAFRTHGSLFVVWMGTTDVDQVISVARTFLRAFMTAGTHILKRPIGRLLKKEVDDILSWETFCHVRAGQERLAANE